MKKLILSVLLLCSAWAQAEETRVILVTLDGVRWQELFHGVDPELIQDKRYVKKPERLRKDYWHKEEKRRRERLMPFVWGSLARQGVMLGDRKQGSRMRISNPWYFSYPGYNEILTGRVDPSIDSNASVDNPNTTVLEWLAKARGYRNLAVFASWDAFPSIYAVKRSGLMVNAGFMPVAGYALSERMRFLNRLQEETPSPWETVRLDVFTHHFALDWLKKQQPRVLAIHYGETDDFAHDGRYDHYVDAIHRADHFLADLWKTVQTLPAWRGHTVLLVTTDHGRGRTAEDWQHHGSVRAMQGYMKDLQSRFPQGIKGADETWLLAMGPGIAQKGVLKTDETLQATQIVPTLLRMLGEDPKAYSKDLPQALPILSNPQTGRE